MIKASAPVKEPPVVNITSEDIDAIAAYLAAAGDAERSEKAARLRYIREDRIEGLMRDIREYEERIETRDADIKDYEREAAGLEAEIADMPTPEPVAPEVANAELARLGALSYVKSFAIEGRNLIVTTHKDSLYTTLEHKYSRAEQWYSSRPYKIPLPAYKIRIGLYGATTRANNDSLCIALAHHKTDTAHFPDWISRYNVEPHPHWGTSRVESPYGGYKGVCLGEYESEITQAFRKSIADGLIAFVLYLQNAGTENAYIHRRHVWALWMGKKEYYPLIVAKSTETVGEEDD